MTVLTIPNNLTISNDNYDHSNCNENLNTLQIAANAEKQHNNNNNTTIKELRDNE